ncbi:MAG: hypothetical protein MUC92_10830 [Fimbriimonadaceae bacterium]|nr:hypothetical protein [Fimbriimonadaceae bacterium]
MKNQPFLSISFLVAVGVIGLIWFFTRPETLEKAGANLDRALRTGDVDRIASYVPVWEKAQLDAQGVDLKKFVAQKIVPLYKSQFDLTEARLNTNVPVAERIYEVRGQRVAGHSINMVHTDDGPKTFVVRSLYLDRIRALTEANDVAVQSFSGANKRMAAMIIVMSKERQSLESFGLTKIPSRELENQPIELSRFVEGAIAYMREKGVSKAQVDGLLRSNGLPLSTGEERILLARDQ